MTLDITHPSRRSVAKGAAWAVPAVAVAAAAPTLAASSELCTGTADFSVRAECPPTDIDLLDGNSESLYFVIDNESDCTVAPVRSSPWTRPVWRTSASKG